MAEFVPLPIAEVAAACGILEVRSLETDAFEGGLVQDENKVHGYILVRAGMPAQRQRFTVAHELAHFVNLRHVAPPGTERILCDKEHLRASGKNLSGRHGMEAQANEFAACILMPREHVAKQPFMRLSPEMAHILMIQGVYDVSKEAAARRYAELHGADFAVVFSREGRLLYAVRGGDFPWLEVRPGGEIFRKTLTREFHGTEDSTSEQAESDSSWWLGERDAGRWLLWEEVLVQRNGYRMTLLVGDRIEDDE